MYTMTSLTELLKNREAQKQQSMESKFPQGVTEYVRMGRNKEVNEDGRTLVILAEPNDWFPYFVHSDSQYTGNGYDNFIKLHTCLHNPGEGEGIGEYLKKGTLEDCPTCGAMTTNKQRAMNIMIPVYDPEYDALRFIDTKEFHASNLIKDFQSIERTAKKFMPDYTLVGKPVHIFQDDKTYSLTNVELSDEEEEDIIKKAKALLDGLADGFEFHERIFLRERPELVDFVKEADPERFNVSVVANEKGAKELEAEGVASH